MKFTAINLERTGGHFERALDAIAKDRCDLDLAVTHVRSLEDLHAMLHAPPSSAPLPRAGAAWPHGRASSEWTDTFVFIDPTMGDATEIQRVLASVSRRRIDSVRADHRPSPAVLFHSPQLESRFGDLAHKCDEELVGLFVYRALDDYGYGRSGAAFVRLQYAIEGLFSTNWTRLSARRAPLSRDDEPGPALFESRQRNNRLEPFDDHGPFLSVQIHDLSRIVALAELGSLTEAIEAFVADHEPALAEDLPSNEEARMLMLLGKWRGTADYERRERRLRRILKLYGDCPPALDDDTTACFDRIGFPIWLNATTLQVQNVELRKAVEDFVATPSPDWQRCWLRAAECYLRRLREQVIT